MTKTATTPPRAFTCFFAGVACGCLFGLPTGEFWGEDGPVGVQIREGFWGIVGGFIGLAYGMTRLYERYRERLKEVREGNAPLGTK